MNYSKSTKNKSKKEETLITETPVKKKKTVQKEPQEAKVDIKGAINLPGIYP